MVMKTAWRLCAGATAATISSCNGRCATSSFSWALNPRSGGCKGVTLQWIRPASWSPVNPLAGARGARLSNQVSQGYLPSGMSGRDRSSASAVRSVKVPRPWRRFMQCWTAVLVQSRRALDENPRQRHFAVRLRRVDDVQLEAVVGEIFEVTLQIDRLQRPVGILGRARSDFRRDACPITDQRLLDLMQVHGSS